MAHVKHSRSCLLFTILSISPPPPINRNDSFFVFLLLFFFLFLIRGFLCFFDLFLFSFRNSTSLNSSKTVCICRISHLRFKKLFFFFSQLKIDEFRKIRICRVSVSCIWAVFGAQVDRKSFLHFVFLALWISRAFWVEFRSCIIKFESQKFGGCCCGYGVDEGTGLFSTIRVGEYIAVDSCFTWSKWRMVLDRMICREPVSLRGT